VGIGWRDRFTLRFAEPLKPQRPGYTGAGLVGLVVVNLHPGDPRHREPSVGESVRDTRRDAASKEPYVGPVSDLEAVVTDSTVQTAAAGDAPVQEDAEDYVSSLTPLVVPLVDHRYAALEWQWLLSDPRHPRAQVIGALKDRLAEFAGVRGQPSAQHQPARPRQAVRKDHADRCHRPTIRNLRRSDGRSITTEEGCSAVGATRRLERPRRGHYPSVTLRSAPSIADYASLAVLVGVVDAFYLTDRRVKTRWTSHSHLIWLTLMGDLFAVIILTVDPVHRYIFWWWPMLITAPVVLAAALGPPVSLFARRHSWPPVARHERRIVAAVLGLILASALATPIGIVVMTAVIGDFRFALAFSLTIAFLLRWAWVLIVRRRRPVSSPSSS
jgi:hypothetical protein